jgi:aldose 1-epimerase
MNLPFKTIKLETLLIGVLCLCACNSTLKNGGNTKNISENRPTDSTFEKTIDGKQVHLFTLENKNGMKALITNYGGRLVSLFIPDKDGKPTDVVAGFTSVAGYQKSSEPYFGATIGRYGNRIAKGEFKLDGKTYTLFKNNGPNTLHGGKKGYQDVVWNATKLDAQTLALNYLSKDMEEGFPGNLQIKVTYQLTDNNGLKISYQAVSDKNTVVNLTNHAFFNLNGEASGSILNHTVQINADAYTPVDSTLIPTGKIEPVAQTPFDFRTPKTIGARINDKNGQLTNGKGYDHNYVLNKHAVTLPVAVVKGDKSGIAMEVYTDQPGLQFYSGNFMQSKNRMKSGHNDDFRTAFAMETQHFPDSPNQPAFTSTELKPGQNYQTETIYRFKISK